MFSGNPATPASHQPSEVFQEGKGDLVQKSPFLGSGAWGWAGGQPLRPGKDKLLSWRKGGPGPGLSPIPWGGTQGLRHSPWESWGGLKSDGAFRSRPVEGDIQLLRENGAKLLFPAHLSCGMRFSPTGSALSRRRFSSRARGWGWGAGAPLLPVPQRGIRAVSIETHPAATIFLSPT